MRESIGYTYTLNIIIIFILIAFAILMAIMNYSKAFKINNRIMNEIEKCEGYNKCAAEEINRILTSYGYSRIENPNCPKRDGADVLSNANIGVNNFEICVYYSNKKNSKVNDEFKSHVNGEYKYRYGILTFYHVDLPLIDQFRLPVYTRTDWIYDFTRN